MHVMRYNSATSHERQWRLVVLRLGAWSEALVGEQPRGDAVIGREGYAQVLFEAMVAGQELSQFWSREASFT